MEFFKKLFGKKPKEDEVEDLEAKEKREKFDEFLEIIGEEKEGNTEDETKVEDEEAEKEITEK